MQLQFIDNAPVKNHIDYILSQTLVITVKKSFWASKECHVFPNRIYTKKVFWGPGRWGSQSRNPANNLTAVINGFFYAMTKKPRILIIGSASRSASWFARFKRAGLLNNTKLIVTTQSYLNDILASYYDIIISYSRREAFVHNPILRDKYVFIPLPADGDFDSLQVHNGDYIFSGGGAGRDFFSLIKAIEPLNTPLKLVTFSPKTLNHNEKIPDNIEIHWDVPPRQFLELMAKSCFVVIPLQPGEHSHGQTSIVQAIRLGKAVISTANASVDDYVIHDKNGILVPSGNIEEYRQAVIKLTNNPTLRSDMQQYSRQISYQHTYAHFACKLIEICTDII